MVSRSHSSTPVPIDAGHPIHSLNIGNQDQIASLSKQTPIILLNQQEENGFQTPELVALRNSNKYVFVINWLYNYRGYLNSNQSYLMLIYLNWNYWAFSVHSIYRVYSSIN